MELERWLQGKMLLKWSKEKNGQWIQGEGFLRTLDFPIGEEICSSSTLSPLLTTAWVVLARWNDLHLLSYFYHETNVKT